MTPDTARAILGAVDQPILVIDRHERILAANAACESLMGPALLGRHYATIIRQPNLLELIDLCFSSGDPGEGRYLLARDGQDATFVVRAKPYQNQGDAGMVLSFEDITPVERAGQMRRNFVANASHELRTPLTAIQGFIETLKGPARDDPAARERFLDIMAAEATRMNRLVRDLLSLTRVESEERLRPSQRADVVVILRATLAAMQGMIGDNGVDLQLDIPFETLEVDGDADQLTQVFQNLIENAIKYGGRDGRVFVTMRRLEREAVLRTACIGISVRDEGEGIEDRHIPRLTERFYRVDSHRSRQMGGTGLGLAIVKHIVNRHRGRLRVDSVLGEGSVFTVLLPIE